MLLRNLESSDFNVLILQTNSVKLHTFIKDRAKRKYKSSIDTTIEVKTKKDIKRVKDVLGTTPPFSDRWFVDVVYDSKKLSLKDLVEVISISVTCSFFVTVENYKDYKSLKDSLDKKKVTDVLDYYINYLRRNDFVYLYDAFVPEDKRMTKALFDYFVQSYAGDIESVFDLFLACAGGKIVSTRKQIADICGIGGLSIESYVFMLLKPPSQTEKGMKKVLKNRIQAGRELGQVYNFGTMYSYTMNCIMSLIELKMLKISGNVYKDIRSLPDGYNEKKLSRYQRYLWRLDDIPLSRLLRLGDCLGNKRWRSEADYLDFIYNYFKQSYTIKVMEV